MTSLEFDQWIKHAEDNNFLLTPDALEKLTVGQKYKVIQADYVRFLYVEYGKKYNMYPNVGYDATFLEKFADYMTPTNDKKNIFAPVMQDDYTVKKEQITAYRVKMKLFGYKREFDASLNKIESNKYLVSGSGDGCSRYMLWENLLKMPKLQFYDKASGEKSSAL